MRNITHSYIKILIPLALLSLVIFATPVSAQVEEPTNITGLSSCAQESVFDFIILGYCGDRIQKNSDGSLPTFNSLPILNGKYAEGDVLKCYLNRAIGTGDCTVTHPDGSFDTYNQTTTGSQTTTNNDSSGQPVAQIESSRFDNVGCSLDPTSWGNCLIDLVGSTILTFTTFLLAIAGVLFNLAVVKLVYEFAEVIGNSPGLLLAWSMLRDIGNMALLFGFIFIGIATILDISKYTYRKALPMLIIVAIAMNFSLFVAEAIIDTSNVFAAVMYEQASANSCPSSEGTLNAEGSGGFDSNFESLRNDCLVNMGIAGSLMQATGLAEILTIDFGVGKGSIMVYLGLSLFALIGAIVMFAAAIMLTVRAVTLTLLMIMAPLGFAAMAIPPLQSQARKWWDMLLKQSFFAPILILLILISLKVTEGFAVGSGQLTLAGALTNPNASAMGIILVFTLVIGFLIASLVAAKSFGAVGATFATQTAAKIGFGTAGWAGRNTAGRASGAVANRIRNSRIGGTEGGRLLATTFDKGKKASFDLRATKLGKATKLDFGKPQKGGLEQAQKDKDKARVAYAESIKDRKTEKDKDEIREIEKAAATAKETEETKSAETLTRISNEKEGAQGSWDRRRKELDTNIEVAETTVLKNKSGEEKERLEKELETAEKNAREALSRGDTSGAVAAQKETTRLKEVLTNFEEKSRQDNEILEKLRAARKSESDAFSEKMTELSTAERAEKERKDKVLKDIEETRQKNVFDRTQGGRYALHLEQQQFNWRKGTQKDKTAENIRKRLKESSRDKDIRKIVEKLDEGTGKTDEVKEEISKVKDDLEKEGGDSGAA